jgi:alanine-glyoxylate transaminase/serine-glyoxylate transaminase/serine-pyruvate transaminase
LCFASQVVIFEDHNRGFGFCWYKGTGAWESALTNVLSPGDKIISFLIGQFSLLWIDQMKRLNFDVDVIESEWGAGADLTLLKKKLSADYAHSIKAVCIVHNETSTGVTNDLAAVRRILGEPQNDIPIISLFSTLSSDVTPIALNAFLPNEGLPCF